MNILLKIFLIILFTYSKSIFAIQANDISLTKINTEHDTNQYLVRTKLVFSEISRIDLSEGHFKATVEMIMSWNGAVDDFKSRFGSTTIHGTRLNSFLKKIWHPEFYIANSEGPRTVQVKTLGVHNNQLELFERFEVSLSIDGEMPQFPFGNLDLYLEIAGFSGNTQKMLFQADTISLGYPHTGEQEHRVVKGNWIVDSLSLEPTERFSLNHGGQEPFSYLISHVNVSHSFLDSSQKIFFPIISIVLLSLVLNHYFPIRHDVNIDWKVGGQLTLFLTVPALKFALAEELPSTHYLNFTDALFIWVTLVVTFNLLIGTGGYHYLQNEKMNNVYRLERISRWASPLFALLVLSAFYVSLFH